MLLDFADFAWLEQPEGNLMDAISRVWYGSFRSPAIGLNASRDRIYPGNNILQFSKLQVLRDIWRITDSIAIICSFLGILYAFGKLFSSLNRWLSEN